jgi:hypothetical protein
MHRWDTLTELWHGAADLILMGTREEITTNGLTQILFDPVLAANSLQYDMDLAEDLWLTRGRFTSLQRDYVDPTSLRQFIQKSSEVSPQRAQIAQMQCRMKGQRHLSYRWGNCIIGFTFRAHPAPILTMFSRTSMVTRIGGLDLALTMCIGKLIAEARGENYLDYGFVWHASSLQHSALQGVPYFYTSGWIDEVEEYTQDEIEELPALRGMMKQLAYFDSLDDRGVKSKLGTRRRVREQRAEYVANGTLGKEPVPVNTLDLSKLKEPLEEEEDA